MSKIAAQSMVQGVLRAAYEHRYHRGHALAAERILRSLQAARGRLSGQLLRTVREYARDVFGHERYAPWLRVYASFAGRFKEGWIPDNYYGAVVVPKLKGDYGEISSMKALTSSVLQSPVIPDIGSYVNGLFLTRDNVVTQDGDVATLLFADADRVVFKADHSIQGRGIHVLDRSSFSAAAIRSMGNGVFQSYIAQHELFNRFAPNSVATVRVTTAVDDRGDVSVRACYLRLGRGADTHVQSKSHVRVPVDVVSGALHDQGYLTSWLPVEQHPDSGCRFAGQRIPAFRECLATVTELHRRVMFARCVGWDVAIDRNEHVKLMEWNAEHNDIKFSEASQGPCFADLQWERLWRAD